MALTTFSGPVASQNGFLDSSFTTAERDAIPSPQAGLLIYNTDLNEYQVYNGSAWIAAFGGGGGGGTFSVPSDTSYLSWFSVFGGFSVRDARPSLVTALTGLDIGDTFTAVLASSGAPYTFTVTAPFTFTGEGALGFPNYDGSATNGDLSGFNEFSSITIA